jgi:hypothetical protein
VAIIAIFTLPDFPHNTRFLTPQERALAMWRIQGDSGDKHQTKASDITQGCWLAMKDVKVWWLALSGASHSLAGSFLVYFPTLTKTLGYNTTVTLMLCAPPWFFALIFTLWLSRYEKNRPNVTMMILTAKHQSFR